MAEARTGGRHAARVLDRVLYTTFGLFTDVPTGIERLDAALIIAALIIPFRAHFPRSWQNVLCKDVDVSEKGGWDYLNKTTISWSSKPSLRNATSTLTLSR